MVENHKYCLCAGEFKLWGIIHENEWSGTKIMGTITKRLKQKIKGLINIYYDCGTFSMQKFKYWFGRPRWKYCNLNSIRLSHPNGYRRKYNAGAGRWY
ncbi:hypothetical protein PpBr36_02305 [Pyricularia pennisetigena]|uniref:hypothetical protein n=1 Tax=Pyricularia pennisetigena TaxID=1578925 RepID=UPI001154C736|nr:hypothetical protein PpBr36_02305 [Pyricularia pennisetigena]TLS30362.1 hypothetical protein PpBr36_02305 [Pyricularia pennisetigena]